MSIDIENELCLTLAKAARTLPSVRGDKQPHPMTLYRWANTGLKSKSGRRIILETELVGGTRITSREALARFFERLDDLEYRPIPESEIRSQRRLKRQSEQAIESLRSMGMLD
jgi:hypothetical protein